MKRLPHTIVLLLLLAAACSRGQTPATSSGQTDVREVIDSLRAVEGEIDLLQHFLEASTVDPNYYQFTRVKAWVINNPVLRDSLFSALLLADSSVQSEAGADAEVMATPWDDLIQVRFGTAVFKGLTLRKALSRSPDKWLYRKIADSYRYSKDIELRDPSFRLETPLQPELLSTASLLNAFNPIVPGSSLDHPRATLDLAADRLSVSVGPNWGGEMRLGVDEINHPFWANGTIAFLGTFRRYKFGFVVPFSAGKKNVDLFPPFLFRGRRLSGARGFLGEFDLGGLGGLFSVTRFASSDIDVVTDRNQFDYVAGILNLYYSFGVALDPTDLVRAKVGMGVHRVTEAGMTQLPGDPSSEYLNIGELTNIISPYLKIDYLNRDVTDHYTASIQYYNLTLMFSGSIEIVPNILSLEAKYVWPIGGDLKRWEYPEFFLISPKLHLSF